MKFKIEKLDGRHKGNSSFTHRAVVLGLIEDRFIDFLTLREWCWNTWGPSCEREIYLNSHFNHFINSHFNKIKNNSWAWHYNDDYNECCIYLAGSKELELFTLKWL
jgi:hypothetical protein